jgi:hypothetical protein
MNLSHHVGRALAIAAGALLLLAAASYCGSARADVPPPEGYVEQCSAARQQSAESHCEECGTYHGDRDRCVNQYASTPFTKRCQSAGASVWTEVWCRPRAAGDPQVAGPATPTPAATPRATPSATPSAAPQAATSDATDDSCSVAAAGATVGGGAAPWALLGVALCVIAARRRAARA